ncbi:MAG TPA: hypothetical protein V6C81_23285 [Planktothrix sp.]|jgi:hypothetical protein
MNRLLSGLMLSAFLLAVPVGALAATPIAASDQNTLAALETKLFTHPDAARNINERVNNVERFVYGTSKSGDLHVRIAALAGAVARPIASTSTASANTTIERAKQIAQARSQLQPASTIPFQSVVAPAAHEPKVTMVPQIVMPRRAHVEKVGTVVDRIESLEVNVFGRRECAKKLQVRVARLEKSLFGNDFGDTTESITARVNRLWFAYLGTMPGL